MAATPCVNGSSLQDSTNCALLANKDNVILPTFERGTDTPVEIPRQFFSSNLQSTLADCDGTSCKYVGYNFQVDTGQKYDNLSYVIDISQVGGDKGVFSNVNAVSPTMMVAPPGYTYSVAALTGTESTVTCPAGSTLDKTNNICLAEAYHDYVLIGCTYSCKGTPNGFQPYGWTTSAVLPCTDTTRYCSKAPDVNPSSRTFRISKRAKICAIKILHV